MAASLAIFRYTPWGQSDALTSALSQVGPLLPGLVLIFVVGALDDLFDLSPWQKLTGQFLAASWLFYSGLRVESVAGNSFEAMPWLTFPVTVCWLLACTNAFNLIDGLDGLASGVGFFATVTMLLAALLQGNVEMQILTVPLAAALLAFLRYNFNPASIFLGDSGAMLIGFSLGTYGIIWSQKSATLIGFAAPVVALAFPIAETLISIVRRFLRGHPVFEADSGHIHHLLLERGFGPKQVAAMIYGVAAVSAGVSLVLAQPAIRDRGVILIAFCLLAWFAFQKLGYTEFTSARKVLLGGAVRRLVASDIRVQRHSSRIEGAETLEECWSAAVEALRDLGFREVSIESLGNDRLSRCEVLSEAASGAALDSWSMRFPLDLETPSFVTISGKLDDEDPLYVLQPIVATLRRELSRHAAEVSSPPEPANEESAAR